MSPPFRLVLEWTLLMAVLLGAVLLVHGFLLESRVVAGRSMEPTLGLGDRVFVDRWTYRHRVPRPGEVVLLEDPSGVPVLKRVVPMPAYRAGSAAPGAWLWVEGDHTSASRDSRQYGPVAADRVLGRVVWRYWPLSRTGPLR